MVQLKFLKINRQILSNKFKPYDLGEEHFLMWRAGGISCFVKNISIISFPFQASMMVLISGEHKSFQKEETI